MRDPLDELKNLTGDLSARPLPAAEVRRRGNRMRRRRTAFQAVGAAAAVAVIASGGFLVNGGLTGAAPEHGFATQAPTPSADPTETPTTEPADPVLESEWEIPRDFPLGAGIDTTPDADSAFRQDDSTDQLWESLPCGYRAKDRRSPADDQRTAARGVSVQGDFSSMSRQAFVYAEPAAAQAALSWLETAVAACAAADAPPEGAQPIDWEAESWPGLGTPDESPWVVALGSDTTDGSHLWYAEMYATRVGRAVMVTTRGRNEPITEAESLQASHEDVVRAMCLWAEQGCTEDGATVDDQASDTPADVLDESILLETGDIPRIETTSGWREQEPQDLPTLSCQPEWLKALGANDMVYRDFASDDEYGLAGSASTAVLAFENDSEAGYARDTVEGWIESCDARLDEDRHALIELGDLHTVDVDTGEPARWREVVTAAQEVCTDCGAVWFETQGVAQVGDRLVLLQVAVQGGGPTPPGLVERMDTAFRAAVEAAGP
jgi:hypothetical protein